MAAVYPECLPSEFRHFQVCAERHSIQSDRIILVHLLAALTCRATCPRLLDPAAYECH